LLFCLLAKIKAGLRAKADHRYDLALGGYEMIVTASTIDETIVVTIDRPPVNALDLNTILALEQALRVKVAKMALF
jgi:hypothetical protein